MKKATYLITGVSPMLMHSTAGMKDEPDKGLRGQAKLVTGIEEAEQGAYRSPEGNLVVPTLWFRGALWGAASGRKLGKLTARRALAGLILLEEFVELFHPGTEEVLSEFEVDTRFVKIGTARIPRSRAKISEWACELDVELDTDLLSVEGVGELLQVAGKIIGVGDYRPSTGGGPFGRFSVQVMD